MQLRPKLQLVLHYFSASWFSDFWYGGAGLLVRSYSGCGFAQMMVPMSVGIFWFLVKKFVLFVSVVRVFVWFVGGSMGDFKGHAGLFKGACRSYS